MNLLKVQINTSKNTISIASKYIHVMKHATSWILIKILIFQTQILKCLICNIFPHFNFISFNIPENEK